MSQIIDLHTLNDIIGENFFSFKNTAYLEPKLVSTKTTKFAVVDIKKEPKTKRKIYDPIEVLVEFTNLNLLEDKEIKSFIYTYGLLNNTYVHEANKKLFILAKNNGVINSFVFSRDIKYYRHIFTQKLNQHLYNLKTPDYKFSNILVRDINNIYDSVYIGEPVLFYKATNNLGWTWENLQKFAKKIIEGNFQNTPELNIILSSIGGYLFTEKKKEEKVIPSTLEFSTGNKILDGIVQFLNNKVFKNKIGKCKNKYCKKYFFKNRKDKVFCSVNCKAKYSFYKKKRR